MLVTELYDGQGLGNQLWCYVVTRVLALDKGYSFGIKSPKKFKGSGFLDLDFGETVVGGTGPEGGPPDSLPLGIAHYYNERRLSHPVTGADIRVYDERLVNVADNTKIDGIMQDEQYIRHRKDEIRKWLAVRPGNECLEYASDDICVLNFRGGEYLDIPEVFLPQRYWSDAMQRMLEINPHMRFVVVTDDVQAARTFFPDLEITHISIGNDYSIINAAHYLILSNSSFAWFPAWLSKNLKHCIAPKYWSQHNTSDGFWGCGYNITSGWSYLDRTGSFFTYDQCLQELKTYMLKHPTLYPSHKIGENFLVVSNYNNDISWVAEYTTNYLIYDQSNSVMPVSVDLSKVIRSEHLGHNIRDYCTFIIDHYETLPDVTIFATGNIFPRHVSEQRFNALMNNRYFTPIEERIRWTPLWPSVFTTSDGGYCERNTSWYVKRLPLSGLALTQRTKRAVRLAKDATLIALGKKKTWSVPPQHPAKYFRTYDEMLRFCFTNPAIPRYVRFAPGANYVVPKANILKLPKTFYENLKLFVSHCPTAIPAESHMIERMFHTLWTAPFDVSENMQRPYEAQAPSARMVPATSSRSFQLKRKISRKLASILQRSTDRLAGVRDTIYGHLLHKTISPSEKIALGEYRKTIKIYDVFIFFNELDLLEIRLNILDPYVDHFVIVEATETFSGKPKQLSYLENKDRFKKWEHKIIHHVTRDTPSGFGEAEERLASSTGLEAEILKNALTSDNVPSGQEQWLREFYQKECMKKALVGLSDTDICYISDVDEIWDPLAHIDYRKDSLFKFRQKVYAYYLNNRSSEPWAGTFATQYKNIRTGCMNHLDSVGKNRYIYVRNGGWHFTNQGGADRIRTKLESYGHQEFNTAEVKSDIEAKMRENRDFVGRKFTFWIDESDLPQYLKDNQAKYASMFKPTDS